MEARRKGEDVIDFSMGNPDGETPKSIVDKLTETVQRPDTHRYSQSIGIPRLRKAITDWYKRKFEVVLKNQFPFGFFGPLVKCQFHLVLSEPTLHTN